MSVTDPRRRKAVAISTDARISFVAGEWRVHSQTRSSVYYTVNPSAVAPGCTCDDFELRGQPCKHVLAVRKLLERQLAGEPNPTPEQIPAPQPRKTYRQQWPEYNAAQTHEGDHVQVLLADLCSAFPEPPPRSGRRPVPLRDILFAVVFKVWSTLSARRCMSALREAHRRGHLSRMVSFNTTIKYLGKPVLTPILHDLIRRSSLPLRSVETKFAPDSSGFGTSKFAKWYDEKYATTRRECQWVKAHVICGVKTGIVPAAVVGDKNAGDSPQFPELVETTAEHFNVKEISADKAYLSYDNLDLVDGLGGVPYIPFKSNSTAGATPLWDKMFHYFQMRREEFLSHYHLRSNVESVFSAVKRKFGDAVRSKKDAAAVNEVLCKLVCHNLSCVVHAWYELDIDPTDWGMPPLKPVPEESKEPEEPRHVLPFRHPYT
jgi:transposase